jgi:polyisoprenoid-binding protein YceI
VACPPVILRLFCVALACCPAAHAATQHADQASGTLQFQATQAGARFTGAFQKFDVKLEFDPAAPTSGSLHVTVPTASVATQDADRDEVLKSPDFFWIEKHPQAVFHAERFTKDGPGWRADGELTIRGMTKPLGVRFTLTEASGTTVMKGTASLRRLAFGLGQGDWASTEWVGDEVGVQFELKLKPASR